MEKYDAITEGLAKDEEVGRVSNPSEGVPIVTKMNRDLGQYGKRIDYRIFPAKKGIYTADELNSWFHEVLGRLSVAPDQLYDFEEKDFGEFGIRLNFGYANFEDAIGRHETRNIETFTLDDVKTAARFDGFVGRLKRLETVDSNEIKVQTQITGFPDKIIAGGHYYGGAVSFNDFPHTGRARRSKNLLERVLGFGGAK